MKDVLKVIGITIGICTLIVGIFLFWLLGCDHTFEKEIETEYGDTFTVMHESLGIADEWILQDNNSYFHIALNGEIDESDVIGIYNSPELKCYLIGSEIVFRRADSESFEKFDGDLNTNEDLIPVVRSVFLKEYRIFTAYLPYFLEAYPTETKEMLQNLIDGKYDLIAEYGLSSDEQTIERIKDEAIRQLL